MISEELRIAIRVEANNAIRELNNVKAATVGGTQAFGNMAKALVGFGSVTAAILAFKKAVIDTTREGVQYAAAIEKQTVAFEVLLKSGDKATKMMDDIRKFAAATPFQLPDLTSAAQRLMGFGTAAEDVIDVMKRLGDVSMGDSEILSRLTLAYGKLQAKGKATLEELNMFTEAGVPLMRALAEQLGVTNEELFKMVSEGKINFDTVNEAIRTMTSEGGQFFDMTARQAETLSGKMSTLSDSVKDLKAVMVESLVEPLKDAVDWALTLIEKMKENSKDYGNALNFKQNLALAQSPQFATMSPEAQMSLIEKVVSGYEGQLNRSSFLTDPLLKTKYGPQVEALGNVYRNIEQQYNSPESVLMRGLLDLEANPQGSQEEIRQRIVDLRQVFIDQVFKPMDQAAYANTDAARFAKQFAGRDVTPMTGPQYVAANYPDIQDVINRLWYMQTSQAATASGATVSQGLSGLPGLSLPASMLISSGYGNVPMFGADYLAAATGIPGASTRGIYGREDINTQLDLAVQRNAAAQLYLHQAGGFGGTLASVSPAMNMLLNPASSIFQGYGGGYFPYGADAQTAMNLLLSQSIGRNKNPLGYGAKSPVSNMAWSTGITTAPTNEMQMAEDEYWTRWIGAASMLQKPPVESSWVDDFNEALKELDSTMQSLSFQAITDAAYEFGKALGSGESLAMSMVDATYAFSKAIIDSLPQMFLSAASSAALAQNWPLAATFLGLAAASSVVSGVFGSTGSPSEVSKARAAAGQTPVVVNVYGDVNDADRFESKVINVVQRMVSPA